MSIRPIHQEDFTESSFEDVETSFVRDAYTKFTRRDGKQSDAVHPPIKNQILPTPTSTTSSNATTFSSHNHDLVVTNSSRSDIEEKTENDEDDDNDFFSDFQEFRNNKDDFDEAIKDKYQLLKSIPTQSVKPNLLSQTFEKKLNLGSHEKVLRQPRSMYELQNQMRYRSEGPARTTQGLSTKLKNSMSYSALTNPKLNNNYRNNNIKVKKSMPSLSSYSPVIQEVNDETYTFNDLTSMENNSGLRTFQDNSDEEEEDFLDFTPEAIKSQFLTKASNKSVQVPSTQYNIINDDHYLTPQLRDKTRKLNRREQLLAFNETEPEIQSHTWQNKHYQNTASKIETIKQQIDYNTPIKHGRMVYNAETMRWEGNEKASFRKVSEYGYIE